MGPTSTPVAAVLRQPSQMSAVPSTEPPDGALVLAHQGGWDEALFVLTPLVVFALLLRFANRRARRLGTELELPATPETPQRGREVED